MSSTKLNNGTGNKAKGKDSIAFGVGVEVRGDKQTALGRFNEVPTGDTTSDVLVIGAGRSKEDRYTALRVTEEGEVLAGGGGEVYMVNPDTGDIVPVYMVGKNQRIKKVLMSR